MASGKSQSRATGISGILRTTRRIQFLWNPKVYTRLPKDRPLHEYAEGEFYATNVITDYAVDFIDQAHNEDKPLFLYLAYNAPHFPLHAPKAMIDKYMKTYLQGWDKIRDQRWKRIVGMNLLQGKPELSPRGVVPGSFFMDEAHPLPAWDSLTKEQQTDLARRMSIYAAMVDIMDTNIGRVVDKLDKNGELDNTFILFMSDNGACAEWHEFGFDGHSGLAYHTRGRRTGWHGTSRHLSSLWNRLGKRLLHPTHPIQALCIRRRYFHPCIAYWGNKVKNKGR